MATYHIPWLINPTVTLPLQNDFRRSRIQVNSKDNDINNQLDATITVY